MWMREVQNPTQRGTILVALAGVFFFFFFILPRGTRGRLSVGLPWLPRWWLLIELKAIVILPVLTRSSKRSATDLRPHMTITPTFGSKRHQSLVLRSSILSRLLLLALTIVSRTLLTPYDTSALLNPSCLSHHDDPPPILFPSVASAVERGVVWDSVYFLRIAH
ncbi:hypothetical protein CIPAW_13G174100 [Carya illinoinensis]|uniref:GPI mannosyltransferase 2 n=1 Tax=Carya illinoinensis TaxID=32201 RepID=A0A8T1NTY1_CARIL|nr:hypothetical protein CIPAW_13G174100 [Carya illinoinensis]